MFVCSNRLLSTESLAFSSAAAAAVAFALPFSIFCLLDGGAAAGGGGVLPLLPATTVRDG